MIIFAPLGVEELLFMAHERGFGITECDLASE